MCGRLDLSTDPDDIAEDLDAIAAAQPMLRRWNVPPGSVIPIVVERLEDQSGSDARKSLHLEYASWGLLPRWARDPRLASRTFNARSETVAEKPSFRDAYRARRCLIPVRGYYEWQRLGDEVVPWRMHATDAAHLVMAGLYEWWRESNGRWRLSSTILTAPAAGHLAEVHDRMPLMLGVHQRREWLRLPEADDEAASQLGRLFTQADPDAVGRHRVGREIGDVRNDFAALARSV